MKSSLSLCFFAFLFVFVVFFSTKTSLVLADGHDGIETECDVCHVNYYHKHVSTPTYMPSDVNVCREYQHEACCSLETVRNIPTAMISSLYGAEYDHGLCEDIAGSGFTALSTECQAFFDAENCFYECDKNVGKWRKHSDCNEDDANPDNHNAWEIEGMPIRASTADAMFEACKNDYFPDSKGMWGTEAGGWADAWSDRVNVDANGVNTGTGTCKRGSEIWADGKDMVENVWGGAFKYEADATKSYVWGFNEGETNPNNDILEDKAYPPFTCNYHASIDIDAPSTEFADYCPIDWHLDETSGHSLATTGVDKYESGAHAASVVLAYSLVILALCFA